jgi:hypothetical protein
MPLSPPNDLHDVRQRFGSVVMLHDRGEFWTDFRPPRLTGAYHAPCQQQRYGIGRRLIAAQADGDFAGAIDDLAARLR